jgi:hypothetical protein
MKGTLAPMSHSLLLFEKRPGSIEAGRPIDKYVFLANAIGENVDTLKTPPDPFPFDEALSEIETYFGRTEKVDYKGAKTTIQHFAVRAWQSVARLEARRGPDYLKRRMLKLFATRDPFHIEPALGSIWDIPVGARRFSDADDLIFDLVFIPLSDDRVISALQTLLQYQFAPRGPPPSAEQRDRAKAHLNDPDLKPWQREFLYQISIP